MSPSDLELCRKHLASRFPLLGAMRQRAAIARLAQDGSADVVPLLIDALRLPDGRARVAARAALLRLKIVAAVNLLCAAWVTTRDAELAAIVTERAYVATRPTDVRVLSALKANRLEPAVESAAGVAVAVAALRDRDPDVVLTAGLALRLITNRPAIDALCAAWAKGRDADLGAIIASQKYVASAPPSTRVLTALKADLVTVALDESSETSSVLAALRDHDPDVARAAEGALRLLTAQPAIDAMCGLWVSDRNPTLAAIIAERRYVASEPLNVRVLSALQANWLDELIEDAPAVPALIAALADIDPVIAARADQAIRAATDRAVVDAMCALAVAEPAGRLAALCVETGKRPSDPDDRCLFLVVTRQLDAYAAEDFEFQHLKPAYERASPVVRARVMDVYRTGDVRLRGFIGGTRAKPLTDCTPSEIDHFIDLHVQRKDWPSLFKGFLDLPLEHGLPLLDQFRSSGWEPEDPELRSLLCQALAETDPLDGRQKEPDGTSSVFERWLHEGSQLEGSEADLLARLADATPPDGVRLVAALTASGQVSEQAAHVVRSSPHWLIRLAGYAVGLQMQIGQSGNQDPNHWVRELAQAEGVLKLWPPKATPADIERLDQGPAEARVGRLGAARSVLRLLIARRLTAPDADVMTIEAGAESGEFERA